MKKRYTPYNFEEKIEYEIYRKIGSKYYLEFKHGKKRDNIEHVNFNKYLEWEEYFIKKYSMGYNNECNFLHYLIQNNRMYLQEMEVYKSIMIPLEIAITTIIMTIYSSQYSLAVMIGSLTIIMIIIAVFCTYSLFQNQKKADFYKDCINIMKKLLTSHQN